MICFNHHSYIMIIIDYRLLSVSVSSSASSSSSSSTSIPFQVWSWINVSNFGTSKINTVDLSHLLALAFHRTERGCRKVIFRPLPSWCTGSNRQGNQFCHKTLSKSWTDTKLPRAESPQLLNTTGHAGWSLSQGFCVSIEVAMGSWELGLWRLHLQRWESTALQDDNIHWTSEWCACGGVIVLTRFRLGRWRQNDGSQITDGNSFAMRFSSCSVLVEVYLLCAVV